MSSQGLSKTVIKIGMLLILIVALSLQLFWEVIVLSGEIPAIVKLSELLSYSFFSLILLLLLLTYLRFLAGRYSRIIFVLVGSILVYFWTMSVIDAIEYGRNNFLLYSRIVGVTTVTLPVCFSIWLIIKANIKR